jgi:hypothetical protein
MSLFQTCLDFSSCLSSKFQLPHLFDNIIETFSPDFFILSSNVVFDLFFDSTEQNEEEDSELDFDLLQRKIENFCRSGKLILKIHQSNETDFPSILEKCEFLNIPHLIFNSAKAEEIIKNENIFSGKFSFEVENNKNNHFDLTKMRNLNLETMGFWINENLNDNFAILPLIMTQNCFGISITTTNINTNQNLELLSQFAARGSIFSLSFSSDSFPTFNDIQTSVGVLSNLIKTIIEKVGLSIQRKAHIFVSRNNNNAEQEENSSSDIDAVNSSISQDLTLSSSSNDRLQHPLQPLKEILPIATYSEFERDSPKYKEYEKAIRQAICDKNEEKNDDDVSKNNLVIVILGAGSRGPLLDVVLKILKNQQHLLLSIKIFVIEKNQLAFDMLSLKRKRNHLWKEFVENGILEEFIRGDGRSQEEVTDKIVEKLSSSKCSWNLLLISELLGSFGDNELSPECIEGFLKSLFLSSSSSKIHFNSVSCIPSKYTSFISICHAPKLQHQIGKISRNNKNHLHQPFVVKATNVWFQNWKASEKKDDFCFFSPVFTFNHDFSICKNLEEVVKKIDKEDETNFRKATAKFEKRENSCHLPITGILGFFECDLFVSQKRNPKEVFGKLSTVPVVNRHSPDLYSWFPIYFPLLKVEEEAEKNEIEVVFQRRKTEGGMFYSWWIQKSEGEIFLSEKMNENGKGFVMEM